ncbi:hypothetical protein N7470_003153 [Penicillium chermesinum]|nr:hypothetical protein N7470_003153 [Penicillium chermesinum]
MFAAIKIAKFGIQKISDPIPHAEYPPGFVPGTDTQFESAPPKRSNKMGMLTTFIRFVQFVLALTVMGLYGTDVRHDHEDKHTWHAKWVFALIVSFFASVTSAAHLILPFCMSRTSTFASPKLKMPQFAWEFVLCILWLVLFGIFGRMYIGVYPDEDSKSKRGSDNTSDTSSLGDASKITRMRHAVWFDLTNLILWVFTAALVLMSWLKSRRAAPVPDFEKV